jgi:putative restriction endonuclease
MTKDEILEKFRKIAVWSRGGERAPNKPLLLLYVLGQLENGKLEHEFAEIEKPVSNLLREFGPKRKSVRPEYPFWRLKNDGLWELKNFEAARPRKSNTDPPKSELLKNQVTGFIQPEIVEAFEDEPLLFAEVVSVLLDAHFPETLHEDILDACGITLDFLGKKKRRDPEFRDLVLKAYRYECAICGSKVQLGSSIIALEAAHIKWHAAGGPDSVNNGIAMCSLHHKLFDRGAFTISKVFETRVSEEVHGNSALDRWLMDYHGQQIREPVSESYVPRSEFLNWHAKEVFRAPERA